METPSASDAGQPVGLEALATVLKLIFSWVILTPIAIIVSGKLLAHRLRLTVNSRQLFRISIFKILTVEARNDEVILGFTGFLLTLLLVGGIGGAEVYSVFRGHFGIDPGQFNSLCIVSALFLVCWAAIVYLTGRPVRSHDDLVLSEEHAKRIEELASRQRGSQ